MAIGNTILMLLSINKLKLTETNKETKKNIRTQYYKQMLALSIVPPPLVKIICIYCNLLIYLIMYLLGGKCPVVGRVHLIQYKKKW